MWSKYSLPWIYLRISKIHFTYYFSWWMMVWILIEVWVSPSLINTPRCTYSYVGSNLFPYSSRQMYFCALPSLPLPYQYLLHRHPPVRMLSLFPSLSLSLSPPPSPWISFSVTLDMFPAVSLFCFSFCVFLSLHFCPWMLSLPVSYISLPTLCLHSYWFRNPG